MIAVPKPLFPLGQMVATPACLEQLVEAKQSPAEFLRRHQYGDWGSVCEEDRLANDRALKDGDRILSVYKLNNGETIWCITEADRSVTTLLRPDDY